VRRQFADPLEPLSKSRAAELIEAVGLQADIAYAAEVSRSTTVPLFVGRSGSAYIFK
jgi:2-phosphosulfolactate phosphatase